MTTDEHRLDSVAPNQSTPATAPPAPTAGMHFMYCGIQGCLLDIFLAVTATPAFDVAELADSLPAAPS